jgi:hypothetical protein
MIVNVLLDPRDANGFCFAASHLLVLSLASWISRQQQVTTCYWRLDYNDYRPYSSLGCETPAEFAQ